MWLTPPGPGIRSVHNSTAAVGRVGISTVVWASGPPFRQPLSGRSRVARVPTPGAMHGRLDPSGCRVRAGRAGGWSRSLGRLASLVLVLEAALALRVAAADAVEWIVRRGPARLDLFPDTDIYWELARAIRAGGPYEYVEWGDIPHFAIRTPGYPLLLAACQSAFGERTLPVRLVQAALGTLSSTSSIDWPGSSSRPPVSGSPDVGPLEARPAGGEPAAMDGPPGRRRGGGRQSALPADVVAGPLRGGVRAADAGLAPGPGRALARAAGPGGRGDLETTRRAGRPGQRRGVRRGRAGAAVVGAVRPDDAGPCGSSRAGGPGRAGPPRGAAICALGVVLVMCPWWVRNARVYGRFVPTALWLGASLYDGLNPRADGGSDMIPFLRDPEIWPLDEQDQDAELTRRALAFAREDPNRALGLAIVKLGRYWSPWPNAAGFRSPALAVAGAAVELPILGLIALGLWDRRRDPPWVLLAGPLLYFCACTRSSPARCDTASPARCPRWGWRRSDGPACRPSVRGPRSAVGDRVGVCPPPTIPKEGTRDDADRSTRGEGGVLGPGALPVDPGRRALVRLHLRDRQHQRGALDPPVRREVPAGFRARPGPRPHAPADRRADPQQSPDLPEDRRGEVRDAARPLAAHPGEHPEDAPRRAGRARGRRGPALAATVSAIGRDVEPPGSARRPLARSLAGQDAADPRQEWDGRSGVSRGQPDERRRRGGRDPAAAAPHGDDPPRGASADRAAQRIAVQVRRVGHGRHPRSPAAERDGRPGHRAGVRWRAS